MTSPISENSHVRSLAAGARLAKVEPGEEVVISGISGRYPDSDNMYEFRDNLLNKVDLVTGDGRRWKLDHPEIPQRTGKINLVSKFDASFFGLHYKQAHSMDPMCRIILERAFEAIVDAGINPQSLKGRRCGVFIGSCFSESEKTWFYEKIQINGFGITGNSRSMLANRVSYWLGIHGPSYTVDSACSSSLYALEHAYKSIRDGNCEMALVGSCNLCLHPYVSLQFFRLGVLSPEGACKSFDESANGYARSEAITMLFLQKAKNARRIYANVVHCKTNCDGYKELGITYPSGEMQCQLLEEFYLECGINPADVNFIEAHGTATRVGDPEECNTLDKVFCKGRKGPLLIGSVKSNIGHSEPSSGLCSVSKAIIAMESGFIPPNLHFNSPREGIPAFIEGRMKVVTEKEPWTGGMIGINSFGFGGANCHVLLKWNEKLKINNGTPEDDIPRLVLVSGRTEEAVKVILNDLESRALDAEFVKLLHEVFSENIQGHNYRGFTILSKSGRENHDIQNVSGEDKKTWFIFSGLGNQWPGMGKSLMKIPIFAAAIEKCHSVIASKGIDLKKVITNENPQIFDNIIHSLVGISAVQIGLVDVLFSLGIYPDNILGHSVGEMGCAYADGCLTAEQVILASYYVGVAFTEANCHGSMYDIDMGYEKIKKIIPPEIDIACRNSSESCTLSGPFEDLRKFSAKMTSEGVFMKEVLCSNIPFHSGYVAKAANPLLKYLKKIIPYPKPRSTKWISSSVPKNAWHSPDAKICSAEYLSNNLLNPVLFEESCTFIPKNAVCIEIAPHSLMQAILKKSLADVTNIELMSRKHAESVKVLLTGIGKLYEAGLQPQIGNLYPPVQYPVSRGTPMISPLIRWEHSQDWYVTTYRMQDRIKSGETTAKVTLEDEDLEYLSGHIVDGRNLFPATGYLFLVWATFGVIKGESYTNISVVFENVKFHRATTIPKEGRVNFKILIQKGSGNFEISEGGAVVVSGYIYEPWDVEQETADLPKLEADEKEDSIKLTPRDIYKELRLRGYHYKGLFRGLAELNNAGTSGKIIWANNFVAFMDNMLQTQILQEDTRSLYVPTSIKKLFINTQKHLKCIQDCITEKNKTLPINLYKTLDLIVAGGIGIRGLSASQIPRRKPLGDTVLEKHRFVPHITTNVSESLSLLETTRLCIHLILENVQTIKVKIVELEDSMEQSESVLLANHISSILGDLPLIQAEIIVLSGTKSNQTKELAPNIVVEDKKITSEENCLAVVASNICNDSALLELCVASLKNNGYLLVRESPNTRLSLDDFAVLVDRIVESERMLLLQKKQINKDNSVHKVLKISEKDGFNWMPELKNYMSDKSLKSIILVAEKEKTNGLLGLVNCLRKEPGGEIIRCVYVCDENAPSFDLNDPLYFEQLEKGLAINVLKNGQWGTYRHEALPANEAMPFEHIYVNNDVRGDLSSLKAFEGPLNANPNTTNEEEIIVYYSAINFKDVMLASGRISVDAICRERIFQELVIGFEFTGKLAKSGRRVMGVLPRGGGLASIIGRDEPVILWNVPDEYSLEEAATVPVVYQTVLTAFITQGKMKKGDSVLIHSGTGGIGLAALNVATFYECEIFTTVGTQEKRDYIRQNYPHIPESHIGNSRDTSFEIMINRETKGRGVDLILNSLAEDKLHASLRCLAQNGKFLEIGKFDSANNNPLGMEAFLKNTSFHGVHLDTLFFGFVEKKKELAAKLDEPSTQPFIKPLKRTVFNYDEYEKAFRYMTTGKHIGKVLVKMRDEEEDIKVIPSRKTYLGTPKAFFSKEKSYVILGGLGGFGLELADWLVIRGARKLVLNSRKGLKTGYQSYRIRIWKSYGSEIIISTDDITTEEGVTNLLKTANSLGPVDGIFNLAVVLEDAIFENQTEEKFNISFGPKATATRHLDKVSRELCPKLTYFVIFSSVSCGRGNAGQTNYGMSNSVMERICEKRVEEGYPGLAIQWGAIGEVGLVAEKQEDHQEVVIGGTLQQSISSCMKCMDIFLKQKHPVVAAMVVAEKRALGASSGNIVDTVASIIGIQDLKTVSLHVTLAELGMDSMMAVEIKQTLEREFEVFLTAQDIRSLTFAKLIEIRENSEKDGSDENDKEKTGRAVSDEAYVKFFIRILADEEMSIKTSLPFNNVTSSDTSSINRKAPFSKLPKVFFIPGLEGVAYPMTNLAEKVKAPVIGLQYPYNDEANSDIVEIAKKMFKVMKEHMNPTDSVVLVGYSIGSLVSIELVGLLESENISGKLFLIDGAPHYLKAVIKALFGTNEEEFDVILLSSLYNVVMPGANLKVREEIKKFTTWDDRIEYLCSIIPESVPHTKSHIHKASKDLRRKILACLNYSKSSSKKLGYEVTLIRPLTQIVSLSWPDDYNLSEICAHPVSVNFVKGDHATVIEAQDLADLINQSFEGTEFKKSFENSKEEDNIKEIQKTGKIR